MNGFERTATIINTAEVLIGKRTNVKHMLAWIQKHPSVFNHQLLLFDAAITKLNANVTSASIPEELINITSLKDKGNFPKLPSISTIDENQFTSFARSLITMNTMMKRGETTQEEPLMRFHMTQAVMPALVVGAIFHTYEEMMLRDRRFGMLERGHLDGALIESLSQIREENILFDMIAHKNPLGLDWVDGWKGFSPQFRKNLGFT